jgi:AraC-like DNA-binding protein
VRSCVTEGSLRLRSHLASCYRFFGEVKNSTPSNELCYAVQLIAPFRKLIVTHPATTPEIKAYVGALGPQERLPIAASQDMMRLIVDLLKDEDLGLRAARLVERGDYDVLEYAAASAPTLRAALETSFRYSRLLNDAADFKLETHGKKTYAILHSIVPLARAASDFRAAAFYLPLMRRHPEYENKIEVWFTHEAPSDINQYKETFGNSKVVFSAPLDAMIFDDVDLDVAEPLADPNLHSLLRKHAEQLLTSLPPAQSLIGKVREHILATMPDGSVSADRVASRLHMSRRTLTRHLSEEGHTFKELLDESRRHSAGYYLQTTELSVEDIAFLLGFSESAAFVRAFKRWTKSTPAEYRRSHRRKS